MSFRYKGEGKIHRVTEQARVYQLIKTKLIPLTEVRFAQLCIEGNNVNCLLFWFLDKFCIDIPLFHSRFHGLN